MSPNKLFQFDLRSVLAFTCAVAAVFAVGREDPVIGVVLALLLGVAGLVSVNLANPTDRRGRAFFFAIGFGFLGFILGMGIQCLLWGISSRITWIPLLFTCISTIAGGLAGARKSAAKQVWIVLSVLGFMLIIWVSYRYHISSAERWVASKKLGVVPEFSVTVPQNYGSDHRSSETNLDWLRRVLGITYTTQLYLYEPIDDVEWKHLANLHNLTRLDIHEVTVSPEKLQHICNLQSLKSLGFGNSSFSDSALGQLEHCDSLRELGFHLCRIDTLERLPKSLEHLSFHDCPIDDSHISDIKVISRLLFLELIGTHVSNVGVGELAEQKTIHDDNEDFRWLSKLVLRTETITDESVLSLSSMKGLTEVVLNDSGFTAAGVSRLQEIRPTLVIHYH